MSLQPINTEQVQQTAQTLLAFLSDENVSVPAPMLEGIVSGKSLLRGIMAGQLVICANQEAPPAPTDAPKVSKKVSKKKAAAKEAA